MRCPKSWGYPKTYGFQYCSLVKWIGWFGVSHGIQYFRKPPGLNGQNRGCHNGTLYNYSATPSQLRNCNDIDFTSRFLRRRMGSHLCQAIVSKSSIVSWTDFVEGIQVLFLNGKPMASFPSPSPNMKSALIMAPWRDSILKHQAAGTDRVHDGHSMVGCSIRMQFASK